MQSSVERRGRFGFIRNPVGGHSSQLRQFCNLGYFASGILAAGSWSSRFFSSDFSRSELVHVLLVRFFTSRLGRLAGRPSRSAAGRSTCPAGTCLRTWRPIGARERRSRGRVPPGRQRSGPTWPRCPALLQNRLAVLARLAQIDVHGMYVAALVHQPAENDRGIQSAGIRENAVWHGCVIVDCCRGDFDAQFRRKKLVGVAVALPWLGWQSLPWFRVAMNCQPCFRRDSRGGSTTATPTFRLFQRAAMRGGYDVISDHECRILMDCSPPGKGRSASCTARFFRQC